MSVVTSYHGNMRRGSSTVVALVGDFGAELLRHLNKPSNVTVLEPSGPGLEASFEAFVQAGRRLAPYAVVAADPLGELAAEWRRMWTVGSSGNEFEERAGEAIAAWRKGRLEMPDYYLVIVDEPATAIQPVSPEPHEYDFHLGVLRSQRPSRVAEVVAAEAAETAARTLHALAHLPQGPWWPSVDRLVDVIRSYFPGRLTAATERGSSSAYEQALTLG
ncbi:MAG TPA: hypothetical protein VHJ40_03465 [Actinomycetota bacterium]|nr:hypothetical protein [Actinomycetota bacterium]